MAKRGNRGWLLAVVILGIFLLAAIIVIGVLGHRLLLANASTETVPEVYMSPDIDGSLIEFSQGVEESYRKYIDKLSNDLAAYERDNQVSENMVDCEFPQTWQNLGPDQACVFDLDLLGYECTEQKHFGFDEGQPCVMISLEKIPGWDTKGLCDETAPPSLKGKTQPGHIAVTCEGKEATDQENLGDYTTYPEGGFDLKYFPYNNQEVYKSPLVMVQFHRIKPGVLVRVICKIWSDDIRHEEGVTTENEMGTVSFSIRLD